MGFTTGERRSLRNIIALTGRSAVGKAAVSERVSAWTDGLTLNTGRAINAAAELAREAGYFLDTPSGPELRRGAGKKVLNWIWGRRPDIHFEACDGETSAHIFFRDEDLTDRINPAFRKVRGLPNLEPYAASVATRPTLRGGFVSLWQHAVIDIPRVRCVVTKRPYEISNRPALVVTLKAPDVLTTIYRFKQGINVNANSYDELAYVRRRDGFHLFAGLDDDVPGCLTIDMAPFLLTDKGLDQAASIVAAEYVKQSGFGQYRHVSDGFTSKGLVEWWNHEHKSKTH